MATLVGTQPAIGLGGVAVELGPGSVTRGGLTVFQRLVAVRGRLRAGCVGNPAAACPGVAVTLLGQPVAQLGCLVAFVGHVIAQRGRGVALVAREVSVIRLLIAEGGGLVARITSNVPAL